MDTKINIMKAVIYLAMLLGLACTVIWGYYLFLMVRYVAKHGYSDNQAELEALHGSLPRIVDFSGVVLSGVYVRQHNLL